MHDDHTELIQDRIKVIASERDQALKEMKTMAEQCQEIAKEFETLATECDSTKRQLKEVRIYNAITPLIKNLPVIVKPMTCLSIN